MVSVIAFLVGLAPIRSRDYFWHLATGRWMVDHGQIPATDPFSVGAEQIPWINGAWLFQGLIALIERVGQHAAVNLVIATAIAACFAWIFLDTERRTGAGPALFLCGLALWGAAHRLDARPETAGILCAVTAVILLRGAWRFMPILTFALAALWVNLHPSAILLPIIAGAALIAAIRSGSGWQRYGLTLAASVGGLLLNPWGVRGVLAPFSLARQVESGAFVNLEWLPSSPGQFPLLFLCVAAAALLLVRDRMRHPFESLLLIVFAVLAVRWVRNQGFFFVLLPLLVSPLLDRAWFAAGRRVRLVYIAAAAALAGALSPLLVSGLGPGYEKDLFPVRSAMMIERLGLRGNVYTADQFGGYLIWSFYPERRVLIDGRNELYGALIPRILRARRDGREWSGLFNDYALTIAVEEHAREPLEVIDGASGRKVLRSPSLTFFPRSQWALIAVDPASMLFVRRDAAPRDVLERLEYREWRPDIVDPQSEIRDVRRWELEMVRGEAEMQTVPVS